MSIMIFISILAGFCYGVNTLSYHKGSATLQDHVMEYGLNGIIAISFTAFVISDLDVGYITAGAIGLVAIARLWVRPFWSEIWDESYLCGADDKDYIKYLLIALAGSAVAYGVAAFLSDNMEFWYIPMTLLPGVYMGMCYLFLRFKFAKGRPSRPVISLMSGGYNALYFSIFMMFV